VTDEERRILEELRRNFDDLRKDVADIKVSVAKHEVTIEDVLLHRLRNAEQKQDAYLTKRDVEPIDDRVEKLEGNQSWVVRTIIGMVIAAFAGLLALAKKLGF
jgi:hypothetical protein